MWELADAKERDNEDCRALIERADSRFFLRSITKPAASILSFVEVVSEGLELTSSENGTDARRADSEA